MKKKHIALTFEKTRGSCCIPSREKQKYQVTNVRYVFLSQIVQAEGNFFLHEDIIRAKTEQKKLDGHGKSEFEGTICACDTNETNHGLTTGSL